MPLYISLQFPEVSGALTVLDTEADAVKLHLTRLSQAYEPSQAKPIIDVS